MRIKWGVRISEGQIIRAILYRIEMQANDKKVEMVYFYFYYYKLPINGNQW